GWKMSCCGVFCTYIVQKLIIKRKNRYRMVKIFNFLSKKHTCFVNMISDTVILSKRKRRNENEEKNCSGNAFSIDSREPAADRMRRRRLILRRIRFRQFRRWRYPDSYVCGYGS